MSRLLSRLFNQDRHQHRHNVHVILEILTKINETLSLSLRII